MWVWHYKPSGGNAVTHYCILPIPDSNAKYVIGRGSKADIKFQELVISREQADLWYDVAQSKCFVQNKSARPLALGDRALDPGSPPCEVIDGDELVLCETPGGRPTIVFSKIISAVCEYSVQDNSNLIRKLERLRIPLKNDMSDSVSHLVMDTPKRSFKLMMALAQGIPVVNPNFFDNMAIATENHVAGSRPILLPFPSWSKFPAASDPTDQKCFEVF
jgi:hypothetical protein